MHMRIPRKTIREAICSKAFHNNAGAVDLSLLHQAQELATGEHVHSMANLISAYASSLASYRQTGEEQFLDLAREAEKELRAFLVRLREKRSLSKPCLRYTIKKGNSLW